MYQKVLVTQIIICYLALQIDNYNKILIFRTDKINLEFQSIYKLLQTSLNDCSEQSWNERIRISSSLELYVSFVEAYRIPSLSIMKASLSPSSRNLCNQRRRKRQTIFSELSIIRTPTNIIYENGLNYSPNFLQGPYSICQISVTNKRIRFKAKERIIYENETSYQLL
ncbi:Hypothetical_protein [Hexamita inflata]|uniref:Hypothetical_protein n=1 Tax=Hexamita inflata TaxID=28002 RepID=A0AA86RBK6_9EUKA|nr:Hypothetical protein HINF_LOCUS57488 [Hexamita inflata]